MDEEIDGKLSFLDVLISRRGTKFNTKVLRKNTFSGQGLNYFSYCFNNFKINAIKRLINRAFKICSNWQLFHLEMEFLRKYFLKNNFSGLIFDKCLRQFLFTRFKSKKEVSRASKCKLYLSFPFLGEKSTFLRDKLKLILNKDFTLLDIQCVFKNP